MNQNDDNLGLLSNQSNDKYQELKQEIKDYELKDYGDEQEYVSSDDLNIQPTEVVESKQNKEPIAQNQINNQTQLQAQNNQYQQQVQQQNQVPGQQQQFKQAQFHQQQLIPNNQYQNQYYEYQYSQYQNPYYQQPLFQDQIYNNISNVFQQTAIIIDRNFNQRKQSYSTCFHCKTPQMVQDENQSFICYRCKQINKPNFGNFQCGSCKITVLYQCGLSNLIKCTKCQAMNYVQQANLPNTLQQYQQQKQWQYQPQQQQQQAQVNNQNIQLQQQQRCTQQEQQKKKEKSINKNQVDPMYEGN